MRWVFYLAVVFLLLVTVSRLNDISCSRDPGHSYCHVQP